MFGKSKPKSLERLKERYAYMFISPWVIGMIVFFLYPIFHSVYLSFSKMSIGTEGVITQFLGIENYYKILVTDPDYLDSVLEAFKNMFVSVPFILVVSMVLALLLNGSYKGRIFYRGLYFLPVIIASGTVLQLFLTAGSSNATQAAVSDAAGFDLIDFDAVLSGLNLPSFIEDYLSLALSEIFMLVWQSGIQTILIIAGLQSIPELHYEVARVEGATKWEEFWFITLPMLGRTMFLVIVFTIVENITKSNNEIISHGYNFFNNMDYGRGSASLWFYFLVVGIIVAIVLFVYNKVFLKRWS